MTASSSAVLVLQRPSGFFAVVFGHGRYSLREGVIDERFGLRVVLNAMEPTKLPSLDHKRLDAIPRHTREQLSKAGLFGQFGLDIERDLLRGITGTPKNRALGDRLTGRDALSVTGTFTLEQLPGLLDAYADLAARTDYRQGFPWIDNIAEVRDKRRLRKLDERIVALLREGDSRVWLALPDVVPWDDVGGFAYKGSRHAALCDDLTLELYSAECANVADMTTVKLGADVVRCVRASDGTDMFRWPVRRCLVGEVELEGETYIISEGKWFLVQRDYLAEMDREIGAIPRRYQGLLPKCNGAKEGDYNARAVRRGEGTFHLLDRDLIQFPPRGSVEICDLYDRDRVFVHTKKYGA